MLQAFKPSIKKVGGCDGVVIVNISLQGVKQLSGVLGGNGRNFIPMSCNFQYIFVIQECWLEMWGRVKRGEVWGFQRR